MGRRSKRVPRLEQRPNVKTAFQYSCVWVYQLFAQKVGTEKYRHYVSKLDYGNKQIGDNVTTFWLEGPSVFPQGNRLIF